MKYSIQIPKPCTVSWDEMTPAEGGRHCAECCKTVIDFTGWHEDAIFQYLQEQGSMRVCGRFREEQIYVPVSNEQFVQAVTRVQMPLYKKIAAIFLFAFGLLQITSDAAIAQHIGKVRTTADTPVRQNILGGPMPIKRDTTHKKPHTIKKPHAVNKNKHLMGEPVPRNTIQGDVYYEGGATPNP